MSLSKMAERKDDLHWLDIEEQAVEALLGNVHSAQLRRPLRPFVVLTLDTMDFACWLLGVNAADAKMPASLTRGAGEEEEEGDDGSPLSIPRGVSCLLDESGYDHLITFGILLLGGAATAAAGGSPLALASMGAWIPAWMQNVPVATNVLAGVTLASYGLNWLTEERLEDAPRWFIRLCSANLLIAGLFHLGMGAVLFGSVGSWHIPAEIMLLIKSHAGVQLFAPYYAIQMVTMPLAVTCMTSYARYDAYNQLLPLLYAGLATYCFATPYDAAAWAGSCALACIWFYTEAKELRQAETATLRAWNQRMDRHSDVVQLACKSFDAYLFWMAGVQVVIISGGVGGLVPLDFCHVACALTTAVGLVGTTRPLLRDSRKLKEILAIQSQTSRQTVRFAAEEQQQPPRDPQLAG